MNSGRDEGLMELVKNLLNIRDPKIDPVHPDKQAEIIRLAKECVW